MKRFFVTCKNKQAEEIFKKWMNDEMDLTSRAQTSPTTSTTAMSSDAHATKSLKFNMRKSRLLPDVDIVEAMNEEPIDRLREMVALQTERTMDAISTQNNASAIPQLSIAADTMAKMHISATMEHIGVRRVQRELGLSGSPLVRVCVIDTGVSDGATAAIRVERARDFTSSGTTNDINGHGTFVSGIVVSGNAVYTGAAPQTLFFNAKVCGASGDCLTSDVIDGMEWCVFDAFADVINLSLGTPDLYTSACDNDLPIAQAATTAASLFNVVVVASAGNDFSANGISAPACSSQVIAVGATGRSSGLRTPYSNAGAMLNVMAPGGTNSDMIVSVLASGFDSYGTFGFGTSYAAPHVTGVAALMLQANASLTQVLVRRLIEQTTKPIPGAPPGTTFTPQYGFGEIDAYAAIRAAAPTLMQMPVTPPTPTTPPTRTPTAFPTIFTTTTTTRRTTTTATSTNTPFTSSAASTRIATPRHYISTCNSIAIVTAVAFICNVVIGTA